MSNIPRSHLFLEEELPLMQLCHVFAQSCLWQENGTARHIATYDLYVRDMPAHRNFLVASGLEEIVTWLQRIKFTKEDIALLKEGNLITDEFGQYLRSFRFTGTIHALPEGTIFFPYEPVLRVTASLIEASIIETYLISALTSNVLFSSKAARLVLAAQGKIRMTVGPFRAHSFESGAKACRAALFYGIGSLGNFSIAKKYRLPVPQPPIIAQHLFIKSFPDELSAFRAIMTRYPERGSFMVDTYDFSQGIANAIIVFKECKDKGYPATSIVIDSGDLVQRAKYARAQLDQAGFPEVKIILGGNIDEYKLHEFVEHNAPCDLALVVTEYVTVSDSPKLEVVYKLAQLQDNQKILYSAKTAPEKPTYPGRKQVYRIIQEGKLQKDILGLEKENLATPLLEPIMEKGRLIQDLPDLSAIAQYAQGQLEQLPESLKNLNRSSMYPLERSEKLEELSKKVKDAHTA